MKLPQWYGGYDCVLCVEESSAVPWNRSLLPFSCLGWRRQQITTFPGVSWNPCGICNNYAGRALREHNLSHINLRAAVTPQVWVAHRSSLLWSAEVEAPVPTVSSLISTDIVRPGVALDDSSVMNQSIIYVVDMSGLHNRPWRLMAF